MYKIHNHNNMYIYANISQIRIIGRCRVLYLHITYTHKYYIIFKYKKNPINAENPSNPRKKNISWKYSDYYFCFIIFIDIFYLVSELHRF